MLALWENFDSSPHVNGHGMIGFPGAFALVSVRIAKDSLPVLTNIEEESVDCSHTNP